MPGITMIGDARGGVRRRNSFLPAESRSVCRLLRLLSSPQIASKVLLLSLPKNHGIYESIYDKVSKTINDMENLAGGWSSFKNHTGDAESRMSLAVQYSLQPSIDEYYDNNNKCNKEKSTSDSNHRNQSTSSFQEKKKNKKAGRSRTRNAKSATTTRSTAANRSRQHNIGIVSDSSSASSGSSSSISSGDDSDDISLVRINDDDFHDNGNAASKKQLQKFLINETTKTTTMTANSDVGALVSDSSTTSCSVISEESSQQQQQEQKDNTRENGVCATTSAAATTTTTTTTLLTDEENEILRIQINNEKTQIIKVFWATLLESLSLHIASRTTRVWGKKKIYEIYNLCSPVKNISNNDCQMIKKNIQEEFCTVFHGGDFSTTTNSDGGNNSDNIGTSSCRVYTALTNTSISNDIGTYCKRATANIASQQLAKTTASSSSTVQQDNGKEKASNDDNDTILYIQINIGKPYDLQDERNRSVTGEKKKKKDNEFIALVKPGSSLIALTASRAPSRSRFTKYVLLALETALVSIVNTATATSEITDNNSKSKKKVITNQDLIPKRYGNWNGTEPKDLLKEAERVLSNTPTGRFAHYARIVNAEEEGTMAAADSSSRSTNNNNSTTVAATNNNSNSNYNIVNKRVTRSTRKTTTIDPLVELHDVSTSGLVDRSKQKKRLQTSSKHGRHVSILEQRINEQAGGGQLVATNKRGGEVLIDHSIQQKKNRKRLRNENLGEKGDCPNVQRIAWKWTGETTAAASCWLENNDDLILDDNKNNDDSSSFSSSSSLPSSLPKTKFKCGIVMEGTNIFEGLQSLIDAGLTKSSGLPNFMKDAPISSIIGGQPLSSSTITVDQCNGEYGVGTDAFAAV